MRAAPCCAWWFVFARHLSLTCCMRFAHPQMYDDNDQVSSGMRDIDPFYDMNSDRRDPFRDRDQFWRR